MSEGFDAIIASMDRVTKAMSSFGKSLNKVADAISKTVPVLIILVDQYAAGSYTPETQEEKDLLDSLIVDNIMES